MPGGKVAPNLKKRGVRAYQQVEPGTTFSFFNMDDPVVGGYTPAQVALRRAIGLGMNQMREVSILRNGQAVLAQSPVIPYTSGYDPQFKSEFSEYDPARPKALLDTYGFVDRDGDGWREMPDGRPLLLRLASRSDQTARRSNELWTRRMRAVGLRMAFDVAPFGELIKRSLAGQLMMWSFNWSGPAPDCDFFLGLGYGPNADQSNDARFRLPAYDRLYERQRVLPDGPERLALIGQATRTLLAYMPYLPHYHLVQTILTQPRVRVHLRHPFLGDWGRYSEVESPA
jgi:ABC-type transport system substrate-binding protein